MSEVKGLISTIQKYSTKDGPGIRSTVFLVGCNLRCIWCANPELMEPGTKVMYFDSRCRQCGACVAAAANHSIEFSGHACKIDRGKCTNIEDCIDICPYEAYEKIGYEITASDLYKKLKRDEVFYSASGGGVTFSGGEAGLQDELVYETAKLLRADGIHVALDTAGLLKPQKLERLLEQVDLVLYDIKAFDEKLHKKCTGVSNELILQNAELTASIGKPMRVRMVIVPGMNDDMDDIKARFEFIRSLGNAVEQVDILRYHKLGISKYHRIGKEYELDGIPECTDSFIEKLKQLEAVYGLNFTVGG